MADLFKTKKRFSGILSVLFIILLIAGGVILTRLYEFEKPQITLLSEISLMGSSQELSLSVEDEKSGIQEITVFISQGDKRFEIHHKQMVRKGYIVSAGPNRLEEKFTIDIASLGFEDGRADVTIEARDFSFWRWMRGNQSSLSFPVVLDTKAPKIWMLDSPKTIKPGSAGIVVYRVSEPIGKHGVEIDGFFHPGFPVPTRGEDIFAAMIGINYDAVDIKKATIIAYDQAGNQGSTGFGVHLRQVAKKSDRIDVGDGFLDNKIPEFSQYYPEMETVGSKIDKYIYVNNTVRQANADKIKEICSKSLPEKLWEGSFKRMRRSSRRAGFAEYRSYFYAGKEVDKQVHLGVDLASVRRAEVESANRGVVVSAQYLGIYGHMVIVDHGMGVFSLYSHLSQINVQVGDRVEKGAVLGNTGTSGMAGGDHLHFSVLINGIFVNPLEWWDKTWLELNILNYLAGR